MAKRKPKVQKKQIKRYVDELDLPARNKLKAVALKYDVKTDRAPKIVATGRGVFAEEILQLAEEHRIPFLEDESLATLLGKLEFDGEIPAELYPVVAEVMAFIFHLNKLSESKKKKQRQS